MMNRIRGRFCICCGMPALTDAELGLVVALGLSKGPRDSHELSELVGCARRQIYRVAISGRLLQAKNTEKGKSRTLYSLTREGKAVFRNIKRSIQ